MIGLLVLAAFNLFDTMFTYYGLSRGLVTEANPLMNIIWSSHPLLFLAIKILLSLFVILIAFKVEFKRKTFTSYLCWIANGLYGMITCFHLFWIFYLVV